MLTFIKHRELEQSYQQFNFEDFMQLNGQIFRALENRKTQCIASSANTYFIKQHLGIGWKEIFKNLFSLRLPVVSAENEYRAIGLLAQLNIPTLKVVAYGKKGLNPASLKSFIMTEALQDIVSLEDLCRTWPVQAPTFTFKQALIKELARIASLIHQHGLNHRDFYLCHFLLRLDNLPKVKLHVIDLHRAQIRKKNTAPMDYKRFSRSILLKPCNRFDAKRFATIYSMLYAVFI